MLKKLSILSCLFIGSTLFPPETSASEKWALLIGITNYENENIPSLKFAEKDAANLKNILIQYSRFKEQNIRMLLGNQATALNIKIALEWLGENSRSDDIVFFFFSGHGTRVPDIEGDEADGYDEAYCPFETDKKVRATVITDDDLGRCFQTIRSQKEVLVFDCCYSGGAAGKDLENNKFKGIDMDVGPIAKGDLEGDEYPFSKDLGLEEQCIITSSDANEKSYEDPKLERGIFSYYMCEAIKGKGDTGLDKKITVDEMFDYARKMTIQKAREIGKKQTPMKFGDVDIVMSSISSQMCELAKFDKDLKLVYILVDGKLVKKGDKFRIKKRQIPDPTVKDLEIMDEKVFDVEVVEVTPSYSKAKIVGSGNGAEIPVTVNGYYAEKGAFGSLKIRTIPWAKVFLDGAEKGYTPIILDSVEAGEHEVSLKFEDAGLENKVEKVMVEETKVNVIDKKYLVDH
jgi:uncharacterized caspase-like protein